MVQLYSRVLRSLALPISTMPRFIIPLADKLNSSISGMPATFTRNSTATYIDANGILQTAAIDVPRFQNGRYLAEPAATNLFLQSGTPATQMITVVSGAVYTVQCFGAGSIVLSGAGTGTVVQGTPVTFTAASTTLTCVPSAIDKAQVELRSKATSYIPTTTQPMTRAADALHYDVSSVITQGQGSLYCEFTSSGVDIIRYLIYMSDDTFNNLIYMRVDADGKLSAKGKIAGTESLTITSPNVLPSQLNKAVVVYQTNNVKLYINGVYIGDDVTFTVPITLSKLSVGCLHTGTAQANGEVGGVRYYKEVLTEAEAIKLTTL